MKKFKVLYIGNDLTITKGYYSTMQLLYESLYKEEHIDILKSSNKSNAFIRMLDMIICVFKNLNSDYILIDTFSTYAFYYSLIISRLSSLFGIPYIPILHGGNLPNRIQKSPILSKCIFNNSKVNVSPSKYLKYEFEERGFIVKLIPNIIEVDKYQYQQELRGDTPRLLYVRAFANIYNPEMALDVLKLIKRKYPEASLTMVGPDRDGSQKNFEEKMIQMNLQNSVRIKGVMNKWNWHKLAKSHNMFINTTNVDNSPVSVIEAMALGLPVVSTNVGGIPYLLVDGEDSFLVPKNDAFKMCESVIKIFENKDLSELIRKNARDKVESFSWNHIRVDWMNILGNDK